MGTHKKAVISMICILLAALFPIAGLSESWGQMNRLIEKSDTWEKIVSQSPFTLGERTEETTEDGRAYLVAGYGAYPSIDGSTVAVPMAVEFARQHLGLGEADIRGFVAFSTTHAAYEHLIRREANGAAMLLTENAMLDDTRPVDLLIGTEPSQEELALAAENGVTLVKKPVCYDAFVFIVHVNNPVDSLTLEQIQAIYTGEIDNWENVGGLAEPILPYQRNPNSGSQTAMENMVMQGKRTSGKGAAGYYQFEMSDLVDAIGGAPSGEEAPLGIGYTFKYYIDELYQSDSIKVLAVDGVYPTEENVRSGAYPLSTHYYGVIREGDQDACGGQFLDWMLSMEGQACIRQAGYIPYLPAEDE